MPDNFLDEFALHQTKVVRRRAAAEVKESKERRDVIRKAVEEAPPSWPNVSIRHRRNRGRLIRTKVAAESNVRTVTLRAKSGLLPAGNEGDKIIRSALRVGITRLRSNSPDHRPPNTKQQIREAMKVLEERGFVGRKGQSLADKVEKIAETPEFKSIVGPVGKRYFKS